MAPSFDRRSFVNLHVCDCSVCAVGGGGAHKPFPGSGEADLFLTGGGDAESCAQLRKLPESTYSPASKQPDVGFTLESLISHHTLDDLYEGPP